VTKTQSAGPISCLEHRATRVLHCTIVTRAAVLVFPLLLQTIISNEMRPRRLRGENGWVQSGEGRTMIDSVVWAQYINVTDGQRHSVTDTQPRRHNKCQTPTHVSGGKNESESFTSGHTKPFLVVLTLRLAKLCCMLKRNARG